MSNDIVKTKKPVDFTVGPILGPLFKFMLPVFAALLLQSLYGAADLLIVGQFGEPFNVSGVSMGSHITHTVTAIIAAFATGTTVLVGQFLGKKMRKEAGRAIGASIVFFAIMAIVFTGVLIVLAEPALTLFKTPVEAMGEGTIYTRICAMGMIFIVAFNVLGSIFRGIGDSRTPLIAVGIACVVNVFGDLLLVGVLKMAAAGAAIATVSAQAISVVLSLLLIRRKALPFDFSRSFIRFDKKLIGRVVKLGLPLALQEVVVSGSFLVVSAIVNTMGLMASAAVGVGGRITMFIVLLPSAYSQSLSAFVAHNIGARKYERAKKALIHGIWTSLIYACLIFLLVFFRGDLLTQLFTQDPELIAAAALYLKGFAFDSFMTAFLFCLIGFCNGCGKTGISLFHSMVGVAVRVSTSLFFLHMQGVTLYHMGLSTPLASFCQNILCIIYLLIVSKKLKEKYSSETIKS